MNKILLFPLTFMFVLMVFAMLYSEQSYNQYVLSPGSNNVVNFNIDSMTTITGILVLAITAGAAVGFNILGSGLTTYSQKLIFNSILYGGIWVALTINSSLIIFSDSYHITGLLWLALSIVYLLGMGVEINNSSIGA